MNKVLGTFGDTGVHHFDRLQAFLTDLKEMTPENALTMWDAWQARLKEGYAVAWEDEIFCMRLGQVMGAEALERIQPANPDAASTIPMARIMAGWACSDPSAALAWFDKLPAGKFRDEMAYWVVDGLMWKDTAKGAEFYSTLPADLQNQRIGNMLWLQSHAGGTRKAAEWFDSFAAQPLKDGDPPQAYNQSRRWAVQELTGRLLRQDIPAAAVWLENHAGQPWLPQETIAQVYEQLAVSDRASAEAWKQRMEK